MSDIADNLEFTLVDLPSWVDHRFEMAEKEGITYLRRAGNETLYKQVEGDYQCVSCDGEVMTAQVAHPIHDGPFPLSGSGKCEYEQVPYCPNCEEPPRSNGSFITRRSSFF